jgi:hypothetical protein
MDTPLKVSLNAIGLSDIGHALMLTNKKQITAVKNLVALSIRDLK